MPARSAGICRRGTLDVPTWQATLPEHDCMWANETSGSSRELAITSNRMLFPAPPFFASQLVNCKGSTTGHSQPVATLNTRSPRLPPLLVCVFLSARQSTVPHHKRHAAHVRPGPKNHVVQRFARGAQSPADRAGVFANRPPGPGEQLVQTFALLSKRASSLAPDGPVSFRPTYESCRDAGRGSTPSEHERKKKKKGGPPFVWSTAVYIGSTMSDWTCHVCPLRRNRHVCCLLCTGAGVSTRIFTPSLSNALRRSLPLLTLLFRQDDILDFYSRTHSLA